ncbi:Enhancer of polycomb-like protein 1 [Trichoderma virens FT-333]|nr:Enhancer of polycomb-like protein 1 [Trichoderma virens FT-333]
MSSRKVRVKKLTVKTTLPVLREDQIDATEYESLLTESQIATGVDQTEENEYHLQSILKEAGTSNDQEIPVPPPQESDISYDGLYPAAFHKPSSYIRFSQTVEECISCQYDMTADDNEFLKSYNSNPPAAGTLNEDDFERIMEVFEDTATEQTPFASVDNTVVGYDMMVPGLNQLGSASILLHAKQIYEYWKSKRQEEGNKPLHPTIKFETHQETDDTDPYVCFRRREVRQTRKTRSRDTKIAETLKRFRRELEDGRQLVLLAYEREMMKRDLLQMDRAIFEERARLKQIKTKLGIKGDDEDLVNQKSQKRKPVEAAGAQRPTTQVRVPVRPDGRSHEQDLVLLSDQLAEKENELRNEIETKVQNHRRWNQNHIDLTRDPLSPVKALGMELKFRPAKTQYLMTPPASTSSESMDVDDVPEPMQLDKLELPVFQFRGADIDETPQTNQPAFRRRIGRLQRLWIDRRGLSTPSRADAYEYSDRWKYDSDDEDDEPPVYEPIYLPGEANGPSRSGKRRSKWKPGATAAATAATTAATAAPPAAQQAQAAS